MRLPGKRKLGYYPTPETILPALISLLAPLPKKTGHLLDPCAGTGMAARVLAHAWNLTSWGLEYQEDRAQEATRHLDHALRTDSFETHVSSQAFSVLYLNPPYDYEATIGRSEFTWLKTWTPKLAPDGILIFVIQEKDIPGMIPFLATQYRHLQIYRFPDPAYQHFHQVLIIGQRKSHPHLSQTTQRELIDALKTPPTLTQAPTPRWTIIPTSLDTPILFESRWVDLTVSYDECQRFGIWSDTRFHALLSAPSQDTQRPLLPLRQGHLVQLLAAGMLNNQVIATETTRLVIKGRALKTTTSLPTTSNETHTIHPTVETFTPNIQAWDLTPGPTFGDHLIIECQTENTHSEEETSSTE